MLLRVASRRAVAASRRQLTVAVTGASGYVGSYITEELLKRGHDVRALVRGCELLRDALARGRVGFHLLVDRRARLRERHLERGLALAAKPPPLRVGGSCSAFARRV